MSTQDRRLDLAERIDRHGLVVEGWEDSPAHGWADELRGIANSCDAEGIEPPRDAEGRKIPLGTEVLYHEDGAKCGVAYWEYHPHEKDRWIAVSNVAGVRRINNPKVLHLATTDSWEKLEKDMRNSTCGYFGRPDSCCNGCPAENSGGCHDAYVSDVIRRAKALAGVSDGE